MAVVAGPVAGEVGVRALEAEHLVVAGAGPLVVGAVVALAGLAAVALALAVLAVELLAVLGAEGPAGLLAARRARAVVSRDRDVGYQARRLTTVLLWWCSLAGRAVRLRLGPGRRR